MSLGLYLLWVLKTLPATQGSPLPRLPPGSPVPLGNRTALNNDIAPAWMPSAQVRGTSDILYSCLLTISLSVYSAVHINVPPRGASRKWQYIQKAKWTVVGIFAPEIVVYTAIFQLYNALGLQKSLTDIFKRRHDEVTAKHLNDPVITEGLAELEKNAIAEGENKTKHGGAKAATSKRPRSAEFATSRAPTFSLVYCFFVGMGGFVVDARDLGYKHQYVTLTAEDLKRLARRGKFIKIEESEITDKSKADILAKILVCFQVMWLLVDCLARKVAGYPLTILEVHTFVHVFCALVMYGLWIKKPLNIGEPSLVRDLDEEFFDDLCLKIAKVREVVIRFGDSRYCSRKEAELAQYASRLSSFENVTCDNVGIVECAPEVEIRSLVSRQQLSEGLVVNLCVNRFPVEGCPCDSTAHKIRLTLSESDVARWERISRVVQRKFPGLAGQHTGIPAYEDQENTRISEPTTSMCNANNSDEISAGARLGNSSVEKNAHATRFVTEPSGSTDISSPSLSSQTGHRMQDGPEIEVEHRETETLGLGKTTDAHRSSGSATEPGQRQVEVLEDENDLLPTDSFAGGFQALLGEEVLSRAVNFNMAEVFDFFGIWLFGSLFLDAITWISPSILLGLTTAYGGIHLSIWGYEFPTEKERWLWRVASINVTAFGWISLVCFLSFLGTNKLEGSVVRVKLLGAMFAGLLIIMLCLAFLFCAASRIFIVVESFISLRTVPIGAYAAIPWAQYIPHI